MLIHSFLLALTLSNPVQAPDGPGESVRKADALSSSGQWQAAVEAYRRILARDPGDSRSLEALASSLFQLGDWHGAAGAFARAAELSPVVRPEALYGLACALARAGELASGVEALEQAIANGYLATRTLANDHDLDPLRAEPAFQALCRRVFGPSYGSPARAQPPSAVEMAEGIRQLVTTLLALHPDPFRLLEREQWEARAAAAIARTPLMDEAQYAVELIRLASSVLDVHTSAYPGDSAAVLQRALPVAFWKFPEGLCIRAARADLEELLGARVLALGGQPLDALWPRLVREFPFENEWMAAGELAFLLRFPDFLHGLGLESTSTETTLRLRLVTGEERSVTLAALDRSFATEARETREWKIPAGWRSAEAEPKPLWLQRSDVNYWFTYLPEPNALYMQFNLPRDQSQRPWSTFLDDLVAQARSARPERLVIDLRHNPGGWGYMGYDLAWRLRELSELVRPGQVFVLIGRITQSAGVVIATQLERMANAVFVGEPLAAHPNFFNGRLGNHPALTLPGTGMRFRVSEVLEQYSDPLDSRRFVAPDLPVALTFEDFVAGRDPVLEAALDVAPEDAARWLEDSGSRPFEPYFRWQRPSQYSAFGPAAAHPIP